uniref:Uncharacterized protein n=1 Tax=viral metagenome TaxID=1070528 RepID=A0A6C0CCN6_9ZZZZ
MDDSVERVQKYIASARANSSLSQTTLQELTELHNNLNSTNIASTRKMVDKLLAINILRPSDYDMIIANNQIKSGCTTIAIALFATISLLICMTISDKKIDWMIMYIILTVCTISCFFGVCDYISGTEMINRDKIKCSG